MLSDDLTKVEKELTEQRKRVTALHEMLRYGVLVDSQGAARCIAREIHETARILEAGSNQLELLPPERGQDK